MATVMELIGLAPMGTAAIPQVDSRKDAVAYRCGQVIMDAVRNDRKARDICTRAAFNNAISGVAATPVFFPRPYGSRRRRARP